MSRSWLDGIIGIIVSEPALCVLHRRGRLVDHELTTTSFLCFSGGKTLTPYCPPILPRDGLVKAYSFKKALILTWRVVIAHSIPSWQTRPDIHRITELRGTADGIGIEPNHLRIMAPLLKGAHIWVILAVVGRQVEGFFSIVPHVCSGNGHLFHGTKSLGVACAVSGYVLAISATIDGPTMG
jgi:hypothetical protein